LDTAQSLGRLLMASPTNDPMAKRALDLLEQGLRDQGRQIGKDIR
jgi:hypothetical protein